MSFLHGSAREWAEDHSTVVEVRFGRLETIAFQRHPEIYRWFGADGASAAERAAGPSRTTARRALVWLTGILAVIGIIAPVGAVAALGGDRFNFFRMDAERSVPLAGVLFLIAILTQLVILVLWVARGARWDPLLTAIASVAAVFSGFGLLAMPNSAAYDDFAGWEPWYPAVIGSLVVSLASAVAMFARFGARTPEAVAEAPVPPPARAAVRSAGAAISSLPAAERSAILRDRDDALAILHARGILDGPALERARGQEPGALFLLDDTPSGGTS